MTPTRFGPRFERSALRCCRAGCLSLRVMLWALAWLQATESREARAAAANLPPLASCVATPSSGAEPLTVTIDASGSTDPDGTIVSYRFEFDDGSLVIQPGPVTTHTYLRGNHSVWVTVTDNDGATSVATTLVSVSYNRHPAVFVSVDPPSGAAPVYLRLDASGSRDDDGRIVQFHFDFGDGIVVTQTEPVADHVYYVAGDRVITVTATDDEGATASASATLQVTAGAESDPGLMIPLLEQIWESRDAARYRELLTADFRFVFGSDDPAGDPYPGRSWGREDELTSATHLFAGGAGVTEPAVTAITMVLNGTSPPGTLLIPGKTFPWHRQILVPSYALEVTRGDGSVLRPEGGSLFHLVRGDSAWLPQELLDRGFTPDSSRWYIEGWEDVPDLTRVPDHPPIVTAPAGVTGRVGSRIVFSVSAMDPNHQPLPAMTASPIPPGAIFVPSPYRPEGTFAWVPEIGDVGTYELIIATSNSLPGSARTRVTVLPPLQNPVAELAATPSFGSAPLIVTLDASGTTDADGTVASYRFDFGDGTTATQSQPFVTHTFGVGTWWPTLTVTDNDGLTHSVTLSINVEPSYTQPNLVGNPSFEVDLQGWKGNAGARIARIPGGLHGDYALQVTGRGSGSGSFGVNDTPDWVRPTGVGRRYRFSAWARSESNIGTARLQVTEYEIATNAVLGQVTSPGILLSTYWQKIQVDYTTMSGSSSLDFHIRDYLDTPGEVFFADQISIHDITGAPGTALAEGEPHVLEEELVPLQPVLFPSPVRFEATLQFATSRPGPVRVDVLDLAGRRVRRLVDEIRAPAGMHTVTITGTRNDGGWLAPGVYFYRIEAQEGRRTGRFVVLR